MIKINTIDDLNKNMDKLPKSAFDDVTKRIGDWLECIGNTPEDLYVKKQLKYAEIIANRSWKKK